MQQIEISKGTDLNDKDMDKSIPYYILKQTLEVNRVWFRHIYWHILLYHPLAYNQYK